MNIKTLRLTIKTFLLDMAQSVYQGMGVYQGKESEIVKTVWKSNYQNLEVG